VGGGRWRPGVSTRQVGLLYVPPGDYDAGEFDGIKIGRGNRSTRRKPAPAPLCPPQIPYDMTWARIRPAAVGSQRLTAWAMARNNITNFFVYCEIIMNHMALHLLSNSWNLHSKKDLPDYSHVFQICCWNKRYLSDRSYSRNNSSLVLKIPWKHISINTLLF
jgi:hypothetical protein